MNKDNQTESRQPYEPTAKDIRRECERIQACWSARERNRRAGQLGNSSWVPPNVTWTLLTDVLTESQGDGPALNTFSEGGW